MTARHLQQMLGVKGSSPTGDAAKAQHQRQILHVYMQAEQETKKEQLPWELGFTFGWLGQGQDCRGGLSAQAGEQEWVQIEDFWPLGPWVGFSRGPRKWDSEKQMEIVIVAPPYYIWNCDYYFSKCLLENIQVSACHWGLKVPIWM